jgi:hypothetical protein
MPAAEGSHIAEGIEDSVVDFFDYQHYLVVGDYHQQDYSQSLQSKMFSNPFFLVILNSKGKCYIKVQTNSFLKDK